MDTPNPPASPSDPRPIRQVARSFYDMLKAEGFSHEQIVLLANDMLSLIREDIASTPAPTPRR